MAVRGMGALALVGVAALGVLRGTDSKESDPNTDESQERTPAIPAESDVDKRGIGERLLDAHGYVSNRELLDVLIVTLPDPIASSLDWAFDSHLDAVRRAFERAGYVLDQFELPWKPNPPTELAPRMGGRPGALLFRKTDDAKQGPVLFLVYVIGELSTSGIDALAMHRALEERSKLLGQSVHSNLRIVGPTFSGSSTSLRAALLAPNALRAAESVEVVSGAATSESNTTSIQGKERDRIGFESTVHTDTEYLRALCELLDHYGLCERDVAILKEGTTVYGGALNPSSGVATAKKPGSEMLVVPFPMSIGSLRRAATYVANATAPAVVVPGETRSARTALDLTNEPLRGETPRATTQLTPASIDLLLDETTRTLAQREIKAVLLFASDVRDKLFLGSELKKRLPDLQLFTFEGNVLYLRPEYNQWLRGMVVLSTYPLLLRDVCWRPQSLGEQSEHLLFANEGAEGTFNATLVQLGRRDLLADYTTSLSGPVLAVDDRPGIWATMVGASMMLPLTLEPTRVRSNTPTSSAQVPLNKPPAHMGKSVGILILSWYALVTIVILWTAFLDPRIRRMSRHFRSSGRPTPPKDDVSDTEKERALESGSLAIHYGLYRALLHFSLLTLLLPGLAFLIASDPTHSKDAIFATCVLAVGTITSVGSIVRQTRFAVGLALEFAPTAASVFLSLSWKSWPIWGWRAEIAMRIAVTFGALAFAALIALLALQIVMLPTCDGTRDLFLLLFHRTIEVDQGISMLVPLTLIGLLAAAWARWHLYRLEVLARPAAASTSLTKLGVRCDKVRASLFRVLPSRISILLLVGMLGAATWMGLQLGTTPDGALFRRASDWPVFDWTITLGILGALIGSLWAAVRIVAIWNRFRSVLASIAEPIANLPFLDLRKELGLRLSLAPWPATSSAELSRMVDGRWRIYAAHTAGGPTPFGEGTTRLAQLPPNTATDSWSKLSASERVEQLDGFLPHFLHVTPRLTSAKAITDPVPERATKEVLAGELILYFESVVRQLRVLCCFLLVSVVLTTMLVNCYPFRPQQLFQTASLFVFAGVIAVMVWLIGSMNRNSTLSRASGTIPGELSWDRTLFANLALYAAVPILALVTSQQPELRKLLFQWVEPLVKFLVTA